MELIRYQNNFNRSIEHKRTFTWFETTLSKQYELYFNVARKRFIAGGDYNAKHTTWGLSTLITTKGLKQ